MARPGHVSPNPLSCLFTVRVSHKGHSREPGGWREGEATSWLSPCRFADLRRGREAAAGPAGSAFPRSPSAPADPGPARAELCDKGPPRLLPDALTARGRGTDSGLRSRPSPAGFQSARGLPASTSRLACSAAPSVKLELQRRTHRRRPHGDQVAGSHSRLRATSGNPSVPAFRSSAPPRTPLPWVGAARHRCGAGVAGK